MVRVLLDYGVGGGVSSGSSFGVVQAIKTLCVGPSLKTLVARPVGRESS